MQVAPLGKRAVGLSLGGAAHCAGRFAPMSLDNASRRIDPTLFSVAVGGMGQRQINKVDLAVLPGLTWAGAALRNFLARWL